MNRKFSVQKFSATGNTFALVDRRLARLPARLELSVLAQRLSSELATDGLLVVESAPGSRQSRRRDSIRLAFFNPDGSRAFCGNGTRAAGFYEARAVRRRVKAQVEVHTDAGAVMVKVDGTRAALTGLEPPRMIKAQPVLLSVPQGMPSSYQHVWSGCPHAVAFVKGVGGLNVESLGRQVRYDDCFMPEGTNVDFVEITGPHSLTVRTYERGVERETRSCGSGVMAGVFAARARGLVGAGKLRVKTQGGDLIVHDNGRFGLEGRVELIFDGFFYLS
ncbi:MAG: diaminopimelate epimerase [Elusimicrobiota bacterium]